MLLSKPQIDVGLFTGKLKTQQAFWQDEIGFPFAAKAEIEGILCQYRYAAGKSILKINTRHANGTLNRATTGYQELFCPRKAVGKADNRVDPDGNAVTLVPMGWEGLTGLGVRLGVRDLGAHRDFMTRVLQFEDLGEGRYRSGAALFFVEQNSGAGQAGHWIAEGVTYVTLHVTDVDAAFAGLVERGAEVGEAPFTIGDIARIGFIRDPDGNWIEVAQRFSLAPQL